MKISTRIAGWFAPVLPEARIAILRTVLYLFVLVDIHLIVRDPIPLSRHPELYRPLLLERFLHLPPPSVPLTVTLYLVIWSAPWSLRPTDCPGSPAGWWPPPSPGGPRSG